MSSENLGKFFFYQERILPSRGDGFGGKVGSSLDKLFGEWEFVCANYGIDEKGQKFYEKAFSAPDVDSLAWKVAWQYSEFQNGSLILKPFFKNYFSEENVEKEDKEVLYQEKGVSNNHVGNFVNELEKRHLDVDWKKLPYYLFSD